MRRGGSRLLRYAAATAAVLVLLLVLAQLLLPHFAASRISSRVGRYGAVEHVSVSAWPAVKLLWGDADSVHVRAGSLKLSPSQAAALLWEGRGVGSLDIAAQAVQVGPLALTGATLQKRGAQLEAQALTTQTAADAALGEGDHVRLLGSEGGRVQVAVAGSLFGVGATVPAVAEASQGKLIAHPEGFLLEGFQLTLFSDRHVHVEAVAASAVARAGYRLRMTALLG
jgi:hypothetical protein